MLLQQTASSSLKAASLSRGLKVAIVLGALSLVLLPFIVLGSFYGVVAVLGFIGFYYAISSPTASIITVILVTTSLGWRASGLDGDGATGFEFLAGAALALVQMYWLFRIKIIEGKALARSTPELLVGFFFLWSLLVSCGGILVYGNKAEFAARELLNLLPLLVIPQLMRRAYSEDRQLGRRLLLATVSMGVITIVTNILHFKSNIAHAYFVYQTGRAISDPGGVTIIAILASVLLMSHIKARTLAVQLLLLLSIAGLAITMTRALYLGIPLALAIVFLLAPSQDRKRFLWTHTGVLCLAGIAVLQLTVTSRVMRLLLNQFAYRFLSSGNASHDLSLLNRFPEWTAEWHRIVQSPVFGNGFGAQFKMWNMVVQHHVWMGFSHSSYLYILFKTGFVGAVPLFVAMIWYLVTGLRILRSRVTSSEMLLGVRVAFAYLVAILFFAVTGPAFDSKPVLLWFAVSWGWILIAEQSEATEPEPITVAAKT